MKKKSTLVTLSEQTFTLCRTFSFLTHVRVLLVCCLRRVPTPLDPQTSGTKTSSHLCPPEPVISVGTATRLRLGRPGFNSRQGQKIFPLATVSRPALRPTQPPINPLEPNE
jgi:hypothetical protein